MLKYERGYGQKNTETHGEQNMERSPVIPRINSELFRQRKALGICHRSAAFCDNRRDFGLADCRRCRRNQRISPSRSVNSRSLLAIETIRNSAEISQVGVYTVKGREDRPRRILAAHRLRFTRGECRLGFGERHKSSPYP
jgi:hypothetical protein